MMTSTVPTTASPVPGAFRPSPKQGMASGDMTYNEIPSTAQEIKDAFEVVDYNDFEPVERPSFNHIDIEGDATRITSTMQLSDSESDSDEDWDAVKNFIPAEEGWTDVPPKGRKRQHTAALINHTITKVIKSPAVPKIASTDPTGMANSLARLTPLASPDFMSTLPPKPRLTPINLEPVEPLPLLPTTKVALRRASKQGSVISNPAVEARKIHDAQRELLREDKTFRARVMERKTRREMMEGAFKEERMQKMSENVEKMTAMAEKLSLSR